MIPGQGQWQHGYAAPPGYGGGGMPSHVAGVMGQVNGSAGGLVAGPSPGPPGIPPSGGETFTMSWS